MIATGSPELDQALASCPAFVILRGISPQEVLETARALIDTGFRIVEIPLNSPEPYESIRVLRAGLDRNTVVGAGTVLTREQVRRVVDAGGQICVAPNVDPDVIEATLELGAIPIPGVATPTEALRAVRSGASLLKLFPASALGPETLKAILTVLPRTVGIVAVGGVGPANLGAFLQAGAIGLGTGAALYEPGRSLDETHRRGSAFVTALEAARRPSSGNRTPNPPRDGDIRRVADTHAMVGEHPFVDSRSGEICWVDFSAQTLLRCNERTGVVTRVKLDTQLSAVMEAPTGGLIGIGASRITRVDEESGRTTVIATVDHPFPDCRLNDGAIDPQGRIWCGSMSYPLRSGQGALFVIDGRKVRRVAEGFGVCNGVGWSPDHRTFYMVDTLLRTLIAFQCEVDEKRLSEPRVVTDFMGIPGKPDGLAVGPDGAVWVAMWGGGRVVRVERDGRISSQIPVPAPQVSSCCFAPQGRTLFVTTSRYRLSADELAVNPWSGSLLAVET